MFIPIKIKIRLAILIIILLFAFYAFFYFPKQEGNYLLKAYNSQVQNLANSVALGVKIALNEDNFEGVQTAMEYVKDKPDFLSVSLLQTDTLWNDAKTKYTSKETVFKTYPDSVHIASKINPGDSVIVKYAGFNTQLMSGAVALTFSTNEILESEKDIRLTSLLVSASILLVGMLISFWLSRNISKPVEALSNAAKKVGQGDLTSVLASHSKDEIGALTEVFNNMVKDLSKAQHELNNSNENLSAANKTLNNTLHDLKAMQAQLIQAEKMASLGELTAGIAHEIQNPLNFVNNFSEVNTELIEELKEERLRPEGERSKETEEEILNNIVQNLEKITLHGKRADSIVKGMLQHSRKNTGIKEPTDINVLADECLRLSYHGLRAKDKTFNADFKTDFDESTGKINIVPQDIGRVLLNIINNAFYAVRSPQPLKGGEYKPLVTVTTRKISFPPAGGVGSIEIRVADNGSGIPQNIADKIFQPFFTTKPTGEGTGLGLSLSYDIIKAHNGEIKLETKEGIGSTFIILLPVA